MPIKFLPKKNDLINCEVELDFTVLGIDNIFVSSAVFMQVEDNKILLLNKKNKILGDLVFKNKEKAINFFNFTSFLLGFQIIFKDKFAKKIGN